MLKMKGTVFNEGMKGGEVHTGFWWGKYEGKRPLGRLSRRGEDNIKMDLQEVEWGTWTVLIWILIGTGGVLV